jgi:hypothetical protein
MVLCFENPGILPSGLGHFARSTPTALNRAIADFAKNLFTYCEAESPILT